MNSKVVTNYWVLENGDVGQAFLDSLQQYHPIVIYPNESNTITYYDSFTWQLWFNDYVLQRINNTLTLQKLAGQQLNNVLCEVQLQEEVTPKFWWQLPEQLAVLLQSHLKLRALIERAEIYRCKTAVDIKNSDGKTVAQLTVNEFRRIRRNGELFHSCISVWSVRGYSDEFLSLNKFFEQYPLKRCKSSPLHVYFNTFNLWPLRLFSKPTLKLHADQPVCDVLYEIVNTTFQVAQSYEGGIIDDIDTEFIHDYRVSIRSIRAIISLLGKSFPADLMAKLKSKLSELGKRSNLLRDLDVYLLKEKEFVEILPPKLATSIGPMFAEIRKQRKSEYNKFCRYLLSQSYQNRIKEIQELVENIGQQETEETLTEVSQVVSEALKKQFCKVSKRGREIHEKSTDEAIHALRIQCKKLRYLLEYFSSLFDSKKTNALLDSMRHLQNTMGEFNDLSIQQHSLIEFYTVRQNPNAQLGLAIGALIGNMYNRQSKLRGKVVKLFDQFDRPATRHLFHSLLHKKKYF